eukprot:scaffold77555_cov53-Phaeocystis_antarctica.AAC.3
MFTTRLTFVLASSLLLAPALAFGAVPACVDMDAPSFSMLMDELAAEVGFFAPGEYPTCASAAGVCFVGAIASACPVSCDKCDPGLPCKPPASMAASDFSLDTYTSAPWFVQENVPGQYLQGGRCIAAQYERFEAPTDLGYTIKVINYEEDAMGNAYGNWLDKNDPGQGDLCAIQDATQSQLTVGLSVCSPSRPPRTTTCCSSTRPRALPWSREKSEQPPPFAQDAHVTTLSLDST